MKRMIPFCDSKFNHTIVQQTLDWTGYNQVIRDNNLKQLCADITSALTIGDEKRADALKQKLPIIMPMLCTKVGANTNMSGNNQLNWSGLFIIDIDKPAKMGITDVAAWFYALVPTLPAEVDARIHMACVSARGGLHMLVEGDITSPLTPAEQAEAFVQTYMPQIVARVSKDAYGFDDTVCKNINRILFLTDASHYLRLKKSLIEVPAIPVATPAAPVVAPAAQPVAATSSVAAEAALQTIEELLMEKADCLRTEGNRRNTLFPVCCTAASLGVTPDDMIQLIEDMDATTLPPEEVSQTVYGAFEKVERECNGSAPQISKTVAASFTKNYIALKEEEEPADDEPTETDDEPTETDNEPTETADAAFPQPPAGWDTKLFNLVDELNIPVITDLVGRDGIIAYPSREFAFAGIFPCLSAYTDAETMDADGVQAGINVFNTLVGPPSSGKSCIGRVKDILCAELLAADKKEADKFHKAKTKQPKTAPAKGKKAAANTAQKDIQPPTYHIVGFSTDAAMVESLAAAEQKNMHQLMYVAEGNSLVCSFIKLPEYMNEAFYSKTVSRQTKYDSIRVDHPYLSTVFVLHPEEVRKLYSPTDGLNLRTWFQRSFYQPGKSFKNKPVTAETKVHVAEAVALMRSSRGKTFNLTRTIEHLEKLREESMESALTKGDEIIIQGATRAVTIATRVCTVAYILKGCVEDESILHLADYVYGNVLENAYALFAHSFEDNKELREQTNKNVTHYAAYAASKQLQRDKALEALRGKEFKLPDLQQQLSAIGRDLNKNAMKALIKRLKDGGKIKAIRTGVYTVI